MCSYGVTDRHGADGARRGLEENRRFISDGGRGMVGVHASFTCTDDTLEAAAGIASDLGVGVHIHVAEGPDDVGAEERIRHLARPDWLLIHGVLLPDNHGVQGTLVHNPRSNMNNSVGYANPARFVNPVALGTDGIGADMLEEFRLAYVAGRAIDVETTPETAWGWLEHGWALVPEAANDKVVWASPEFDPWFQAFNTGTSPISVEVDGEAVWSNGTSTRIDEQEVRTKQKSRRASLRTTGGDLMSVPMAIYLQDAHPITEAMEIAQFAEESGFHAVWQADSRLVREATVPMAAFAATTNHIKIGSGVIDVWTRNPLGLPRCFQRLTISRQDACCVALEHGGTRWQAKLASTGQSLWR